jgi:hypothetical protein
MWSESIKLAFSTPTYLSPQRVRSHKTEMSALRQRMRDTMSAVYHAMIENLRPTRNSHPLMLALILSLAALAGCARNPIVGSISVPPIPEREARIWFYRVYLPSETLNMTKVTMNGAYAGYAQLGGAFYRDVTPGIYHIEVESYGRDFNQSTNIALVAGQEAYIRVESLRSWATDSGIGRTVGRDTFYARLILPQTARAEIVQSFFDGGS